MIDMNIISNYFKAGSVVYIFPCQVNILIYIFSSIEKKAYIFCCIFYSTKLELCSFSVKLASNWLCDPKQMLQSTIESILCTKYWPLLIFFLTLLPQTLTATALQSVPRQPTLSNLIILSHD